MRCVIFKTHAPLPLPISLSPPRLPPQLRLDERVLQTERGLLVRRVLKRDAGLYQCHAMEHGFTQTLLGITLEVVPSSSGAAPPHPEPALRSPAGPPSTNQKLWYRDFMQLVDHPNLSNIDQICEQVWARKNDKTEKGFADAALQHPPLIPGVRLLHKQCTILQQVRRGPNRPPPHRDPPPPAPRAAGE